ncbi:MAG: VWA domain-containing protein [Gammaproteobacteria bacterium]|nr:VWA domain-containing protein [Gammaproteobacteria bacterium]MDH5628559.1 VWA domain-containing protein [Gammaproteobacteria bacterium]
MIEPVYPYVLLLILLPLIFRLFSKQKKPHIVSIRTPLFDQWQNMQQNHSSGKNWTSFLIFWLAWSSFVIAAARIQHIGEVVELPPSGRDLLLSIDISGSMQEEDLQLNGQAADRLTVVKSIISDFISKRDGDRIGLVLFGENAYLQTPLTFDLKTVNYMLEETEIGLAGSSRTAIGEGIGLSVKRLRERPEQNHVLILLTDGRNNSGALDPVEAAKLAAHAGIKIYTIGVGADEAYRRTFFGTTKFNPSAELDEKTLAQVAKITGGRYFRARSTEELAQIYAMLDELEPIEDEPEIFRPIKELFYYPAIAGIFFLLLPFIIALFQQLFVSKRNVLKGGQNHAS